MKLNTLLLSLVFLSSFSLQGKAQAKPLKGKMFKELNLSDEQKDKIRAIRKANKGKFPRTKGEVKALHEKLKSAYISAASDSEIQKIHNEIKTLKMSRMDKRFEKIMSFRSVLTEEQRKKFLEMRQGRRKGKR